MPSADISKLISVVLGRWAFIFQPFVGNTSSWTEYSVLRFIFALHSDHRCDLSRVEFSTIDCLAVYPGAVGWPGSGNKRGLSW